MFIREKGSLNQSREPSTFGAARSQGVSEVIAVKKEKLKMMVRNGELFHVEVPLSPFVTKPQRDPGFPLEDS